MTPEQRIAYEAYFKSLNLPKVLDEAIWPAIFDLILAIRDTGPKQLDELPRIASALEGIQRDLNRIADEFIRYYEG